MAPWLRLGASVARARVQSLVGEQRSHKSHFEINKQQLTCLEYLVWPVLNAWSVLMCFRLRATLYPGWYYSLCSTVFRSLAQESLCERVVKKKKERKKKRKREKARKIIMENIKHVGK